MKNDEYSSGDLGDVSHAYVTEHAQEGQFDQSDSDSDTPRKTFAERYAVPEIEKEHLSVSGTTSDRDEGGQEVTESSNQINALPSGELVDLIMKKMWSYCHAYHINNSVRDYRYGALIVTVVFCKLIRLLHHCHAYHIINSVRE